MKTFDKTLDTALQTHIYRIFKICTVETFLILKG